MSDGTPTGPPQPGVSDRLDLQAAIIDRLARLETRMENSSEKMGEMMAKREDIEKIKTLIEKKDAANSKWFITIVISASVTVVAALVRTFLG